ncbi:AAA family ATPase [Kitasatospora sp. NPDC051853]|uniref:AAA family ATPase n=1 Tax=Kitasatospora sp. NPDC051853 TaxID=3364058 RepID=UPI0037A32B3F
MNSARDVQAPPGLTNLPPLPLFLGRADALDHLHGTSGEGPEQRASGATVIHGLGGVGKSTLALAHAHRHLRDHTVVWWITAASSAHIERSLGELALHLFPAWAGSASAEERAAWATTWRALSLPGGRSAESRGL